MQAKADGQLLGEYARQGSEPAFAELVARYTNLVYSVVLRQAGSADLAEEVAQSVFTDLARKAPALASSLGENGTLVGWLYRSSGYALSNHRRAEQRRHNRESQAMQDFDSASTAPPDWERIRPVLDEALAELGEEDRQAMLLRFFQNQGFAAVGAALGISDDAAQKRVGRALEKLRAQLARQGITASASVLSTMLSVNAIQTAPAGLAAKLAGASLAGAAVKTTTATTITLMTLTSKIGITVGAIVVALAVWQVAEHYSSPGQNQRITSRLVPATTTVPSGDVEMATVNGLKWIGVSVHMFAADNGDVLPTDFSQIQNELGGANFDLGVGTNSFEIIDYGKRLRMGDKPHYALFAREKEARRRPNGAWVRAYLLFDGAVQQAASADGNFDKWEKQWLQNQQTAQQEAQRAAR